MMLKIFEFFLGGIDSSYIDSINRTAEQKLKEWRFQSWLSLLLIATVVLVFFAVLALLWYIFQNFGWLGIGIFFGAPIGLILLRYCVYRLGIRYIKRMQAIALLKANE